MDKLIEAMKRVLADTYSFGLKSQNYHWNVEGPDFKQYHELFGDIYEGIVDAVDKVAEHIRTLDSYAPGSFSRFSDLTTIEDENTIPIALEMITRLQRDNVKVIATLMTAHAIAETLNKRGLINFIEERIDAHEKIGWMLRATTKMTQ
jgi:starvation-inducible DNA-binding protein